MTASVLRLSCFAILAVGLCGKSFFSSAISAGFQSGLFLLLFFAVFFFFAILFSLTLKFCLLIYRCFGRSCITYTFNGHCFAVSSVFSVLGTKKSRRRCQGRRAEGQLFGFPGHFTLGGIYVYLVLVWRRPNQILLALSRRVSSG